MDRDSASISCFFPPLSQVRKPQENPWELGQGVGDILCEQRKPHQTPRWAGGWWTWQGEEMGHQREPWR